MNDQLQKLVASWTPHILTLAVMVGVMKAEISRINDEVSLIRTNQIELAVRKLWMENANRLHEEFREHMKHCRADAGVVNLWTSEDRQSYWLSQLIDL